MKKNLLLSVTLASVLVLRGQVKDVELTLQPTYTHQVYFQFGTDNQVSIPAATWDIAFLRISPYAFATRVNDSRIRVFQVANSASQWNLIYIANEASWTELYNSETVWNKGAFDNGSATYGWGEYNSNTHHVVGSIVYVLKYTDNTYRKFMIDDFSSGYTCKYSTWDGSSWGADQTVIVSNSSGTERFNYYSLVDNQQVNSSIPLDSGWDLLFTYYYSFYKGIQMTRVTGALQNSGVEVAKKLDGDNTTPTDGDYSLDINTIGDLWKQIGNPPGVYTIPDNKYYVKLANGTIYKLWFTEFGGTATGDIKFSYEDVTSSMGIVELENKSSFGVYPNPAVNKTTTLVYEIKDSSSSEGVVSIFSLDGRKVHEEKIAGQAGFYSKELNLYKLTPGVYILVFQAGNSKESKKLIIK